MGEIRVTMNNTILLINLNLLLLLFIGLGILASIGVVQALFTLLAIEWMYRYFTAVYMVIHEQPECKVRNILTPILWMIY